MKQRGFMAAVAAVVVVIGAAGIAAPASAAPPTAPWGGSAGGEVASLTTTAVGLNLAGLGVAVSQAEAGSTLTPRANSVSSNVSADVAGLGIAVASNDQSAPPDEGGAETGTLVGVTVPTLLDIGALETSNEAHWDLDTACVTDGVLAATSTQTAGLSLLPLLGDGVLELGVSQTQGETSLAPNTGLNYGVESVASGTITGLSLLGGAITITVAGETTLTARATGDSPGTVTYSPATVTVTGPGGSTVLTPGASLPISIPLLADVTIAMNNPSVTTTATSAAATVSLLSIDVSVLGVFPLPPVATVAVDVLPLDASASAPAGGIDCPPAPPVILVPADGATTNATPVISGTATPGASVQVLVDGNPIGTVPADGLGNWTITSPALAEGAHVATAIQTVGGSASAASAPVDFTVDATAPAPPVILSPADGALLNDPTPPISGTAEPNSTVEVFVDGASLGTTGADGTGNWSLTPAAPLANGPHTAVATATDAVGNESLPSGEVDFVIDATAPPAPTVVEPADGSTTTDTTPVISGTAEPNSTVTVIIDGVSIGTTPAGPTGDWTFSTTTPLTEGEHTVTATATDEAGNTGPESAGNTFTVDSLAPAAPVISAPADGSSTNDTTPDITGTAEPNSTVTVRIDGAVVGETDADGLGNWIFTPAIPLAPGAHTAVANATDEAGNTSPDSNTVAFTVDTTAPVAPIITAPVDGSSVNDPTPDIEGTAEANSTVTVRIDGAAVGQAPVDGGGNWIFTPTVPLADGPHSVVATATDAAGNTSGDSNTVDFTVDTVTPVAPVITAPADGSSTNDTTPDIVGTAEPGSTVEVFIDGSPVGTTPADPTTGAWTLELTTPLTEGLHSAVATATDTAGNTSGDSNTVTFTIDKTDPIPPVITTPVDGTITNDSTPEIAGFAEPNTTVTVIVDGITLGTAPVNGAGAWTFTPLAPLDEGPHSATATATDAAGNVSGAATPVGFIVDTVAPPAPVITSPADGSRTNDTTPSIVGTAEPLSEVEVFIDGVSVGTTPADGDGDWVLPLTTPLAEGPHTASATATDAAGNTGPESADVTFTVDLTAPGAPIVTAPADGSTTNDATPPVSGTAEPGSTVNVSIDGALAGTAAADPVTGAWTFQPTTPLGDGAHTASATATDAAGNTGPVSNTVAFTVDTVVAPPVITAPADGSSTTDTTPDISGTAEPGSTVTVVIDGATVGTATADPATGAWTLPLVTPLPDGTHTVTATATDTAGNVSAPSAPVTFAVDTTTAAPVITSPANGSSTNDTTPAITGTAEPGSTVTVVIDGTTVGAADADDTTGAWTFQPTTPLGEGEHTVTATAVDALGNVSPPSAPVTFAVDTTVPAAPVITSPADGSTVTDPTPPITGTAEPGSTVTVIVDGEPIGQTTTDPDGDWTFTPTEPLPDGEHEITATATDAAGNTGPESEPVTVTVDTSGSGGGSLPPTGATVPWLGALMGALFVALGAGLVASRRRA
ncbi:Ig-like domain-containing protein [Microbacterium sp. HJ5]